MPHLCGVEIAQGIVAIGAIRYLVVALRLWWRR